MNLKTYAEVYWVFFALACHKMVSVALPKHCLVDAHVMSPIMCAITWPEQLLQTLFAIVNTLERG